MQLIKIIAKVKTPPEPDLRQGFPSTKQNTKTNTIATNGFFA
jgi:hypothetical protein